MRIAFMVEGETERVFLPYLRSFLEIRLAGRMPRIRPAVYDGRIPKEHKLRHEVRLLLEENDVVVALTDVYTGTRDFLGATDAKSKMRAWVGEFANRFHPHAAQYDFEAWLLPFWSTIQKESGCKAGGPARPPEEINHKRPASWHIKEAFRLGHKRSYVKPRDARKILHGNDLAQSAARCPELKALLNTFLRLSGAPELS